MVHFAKIAKLGFAVCVLLTIVFVLPPHRVAGSALAAQSVRKEVPLEKKLQPGPAYGVYLAIATSRPDSQMRVQIDVPSLNISGEWARACVPVGSRATPPLGSRVWVMFEAGDTHRPVWIGVSGN